MPTQKKSTKTRKAKTSDDVSPLALAGFARYFFVAVVLGVALLFLWVISPFFDTLIFASLVAIVFYPVQGWLMKKMGGRRTITAFFTTLFVMLILLAPLVLLSIFVLQEAVDAFSILEHKLNTFNFSEVSGLADLPWIGERLAGFSERFQLKDFFEEYEVDLVGTLRDMAEAVTTFIVSQAGNIFRGLSDFLVQLFIFLITVFYFFRDGDRVTAYAKKISPLPLKYENEIEEKLKESTYGVVVGNFGTAMLQGLVGGIGFAIAGIDHLILWSTIMAFASLIPYVGATVIWGPIAISMLIAGSPWWAGFIALWGVFAVSSVDNIARPFLIGGQTKMHSLATFLVVLGGILIFGLKGMVYGPLILSLTITVVHIYEKEYKHILDS